MSSAGSYINNDFITSSNAATISTTGGYIGNTYVTPSEASRLATFGGQIGGTFITSWEAQNMGDLMYHNILISSIFCFKLDIN